MDIINVRLIERYCINATNHFQCNATKNYKSLFAVYINRVNETSHLYMKWNL